MTRQQAARSTEHRAQRVVGVDGKGRSVVNNTNEHQGRMRADYSIAVAVGGCVLLIR